MVFQHAQHEVRHHQPQRPTLAFLSAGMRLGDFAEALALGDDGTLEKTGENAAGSAEQPEDEEACGIGG